MTIVVLAAYATAIGLLVWIYLVFLDRARWFGASRSAMAIILATLAIAPSAPFLDALLKGPLWLDALLTVAPPGFIALSLRWIVARTGGLRVEVKLLESYRRLDRYHLFEPGHVANREALLAITGELANIEYLRTTRTSAFIDLLDQVYADILASTPPDPYQLEQGREHLLSAGDQLWGPGWRSGQKRS